MTTYETDPKGYLSKVAIAAYLDLGYFDLLRQLLTVRLGIVAIDDKPVRYWQSAIDVSQSIGNDSLTEKVKQRVKFECDRVQRLQKQNVFVLDVNGNFATFCNDFSDNHG